MRVSVILSTYNSPAWLEKVIWGYAVQSHRDLELLIADDGSTWETGLLIQHLRQETGLEIGHIWHEDCGFRKCAILNEAIAASTADYLIFSDGDCIPRWDFVTKHTQLARPGYFLSGGCVRLPMALSRQLTIGDVISRRASDHRWLKIQGLRSRKGPLRLACGNRLAWLLDAATTTRATLNGCNSSAWKSDVIRVNGFNTRMGYGGLDRELGERLINAGVRPRQVRHRAVCVHLDHTRNYASEEILRNNLATRAETRSGHSDWTPDGIETESPARVASKQTSTAPSRPRSPRPGRVVAC
jgi:glycosyltransferase involved in cell wall biosynthesis